MNTRGDMLCYPIQRERQLPRHCTLALSSESNEKAAQDSSQSTEKVITVRPQGQRPFLRALKSVCCRITRPAPSQSPGPGEERASVSQRWETRPGNKGFPKLSVQVTFIQCAFGNC